MSYNGIDLIDKAINIAQREKKQYEDIGKEKSNIEALRIMSVVLAKDADKTIKYYEELKKLMSSEDLDDIDIYIYDKMAFLINEFNKKNHKPQINNVKDYIGYSLLLEKDVLTLLIDVQGRFINNEKDVHTKTYDILSKLIENKKKHVSDFEYLLKK